MLSLVVEFGVKKNHFFFLDNEFRILNLLCNNPENFSLSIKYLVMFSEDAKKTVK